MKSFRDIRVIPVVLVAVLGLAVLKVAGLVIDGGYVFDYRPNSTKPSWAQESFNFPGGLKADRPEVTGSVQGAPKEAPKETPKPATAASDPPKPDSVVVYPDPTPQVSAAERAILGRLEARRHELQSPARELEGRRSPPKS